MGAKTKIEWADATWNPVTGCLHGCEYCYARKYANRFGSGWSNITDKEIHELESPAMGSGLGKDNRPKSGIQPYPYDFHPTFHRYRLMQPLKWVKPRTIFVCSMADLFGNWIPDEWISEVFNACKKVPQHRYLFLTKNPGRYCDLERAGIMPKANNFWFGATYDHSNQSDFRIPNRPQVNRFHDAGDYYFGAYPKKNRFVCFEPLLCDIGANIGSTGGEWHIIGAETGNRNGKPEVKKEWVDHIVEWSIQHNIPVFMKDSLLPIMGEGNILRQTPWRI